MLSISLSPNSFLANCSETCSEVIACDRSKRLLTKSSSTDLLLRLGKNRNQLDHYLRNYILHHGVQGDPSIDVETFEEVPGAVKELKEGVIAPAYSIGCLRFLGYEMDSVRE